MTKLTPEQQARAAHIQERLMHASDDDKDTISILLCDIVDTMLNETGAGVLFVDKAGTGSMAVHLIGDTDLVPEMLRAAPAIFDRVFGVPEGMVPQ